MTVHPLPHGFLIDAPGAGRWAVAAATFLFAAAGLVALGRRAGVPVVAGALAAGALGAWLADGLMTGAFLPVGFSLLGAALGGPLGVLLAARWLGRPARPLLDALALPALVAAAVARLGCLLGGCDFGEGSAEHPWSVRYAAGTAAFSLLRARGAVGEAAAMTGPLHPFPLYEAAGVLVCAAALAAFGPRPGAGTRAALAAGGYFACRALAEPFRSGSAALPFVCGALAGAAFWVARRWAAPAGFVSGAPSVARGPRMTGG